MRARFFPVSCRLFSLAIIFVVLAFPNPSVSAGPAGQTPVASKFAAVDGKPIPVAFVLGEGATVIDFSGPWEVFQDAGGPNGKDHFRLFTVGPSKAPIRASGGLMITPDYSFADAPAARIVVIPAQRGTPELLDWLRQRDKESDIVMSVCTGAFQLGKAGLLDGKRAPLTMITTTNLRKRSLKPRSSRATAMYRVTTSSIHLAV